MCVLVAVRRDAPSRLIVGANRDERTSRPWMPPALLLPEPPVFGGRDLVGGGSWLAVNLDTGVVVGVTNARLGAPAGERSRGELVVSVAREAGAAQGVALLSELDLSCYGPFNLLVADAETMWTATNTPGPLLRREAGGVVVLANDALTAQSERVARTVRRAEAAAAGAAPLEKAFEALLADHEGPDPLCRHGVGYGTVCATILSLAARRVQRYRFAAGPPCRTPFMDVPLPAPSYS